MQPFRALVRQRIRGCEAATFRAWTSEGNEPGMLYPVSDFDYLVPFRRLLWHFRPSVEDCISLSEGLWTLQFPFFASNKGVIFPKLRFLLNAHPVLLSYMLCTVMGDFKRNELKNIPVVQKTLFLKGRDPRAVRQLDQSLNAFLGQFIASVGDSVGCRGTTDRPMADLERRTLEELKSWSDSAPAAPEYLKRCVVEAGEEMFRGNAAADDHLRVALARSPTARAYLANRMVEYFRTREGL
jgi:hypothetical protein